MTHTWLRTNEATPLMHCREVMHASPCKGKSHDYSSVTNQEHPLTPENLLSEQLLYQVGTIDAPQLANDVLLLRRLVPEEELALRQLVALGLG